MTSPTLSLTSIGWIILYVTDMAAAIAFYRDRLGIPVKSESPEWSELDTKGVKLALHVLDQKVPFHHPAIPDVVFDVHDVRAAHAALRERQVKIHDLKQVWSGGEVVGVAAELHDPDGNRLSIHGVVPASEWTRA